MKTLHDGSHRQALVARLGTLSADARPRWGRMNVGQMLCHLGDALRLGVGDTRAEPGPQKLLQHFPLKQLVIYVLPWPKGAPTAPELLATAPAAFEADREALRSLLDRFGAVPLAEPPRVHPLFGPLSVQDWSALQSRHVDHHLRQFGA